MHYFTICSAYRCHHLFNSSSVLVEIIENCKKKILDKLVISPEILEICIFTKNRCNKLKDTVESIKDRLDINVTIFDNMSDDNTQWVVECLISRYQNIKYHKNQYDVGSPANLIKAYEAAISEYVWILADDDTYNFDGFENVLTAIKERQPLLIHVGAHEGEWMHGGFHGQPKKALELGYHYFMFSSFIGNNIFKRQYFGDRYLSEAYSCIALGYPHMPYIFGIFSEENSLYISQTRIVTANAQGQSYTIFRWIAWWCGVSDYCGGHLIAKVAFWDHFSGKSKKDVMNFLSEAASMDKRFEMYIESFVRHHCTAKEKIHYYIALFKKIIKKRLKASLKPLHG